MCICIIVFSHPTTSRHYTCFCNYSYCMCPSKSKSTFCHTVYFHPFDFSVYLLPIICISSFLCSLLLWTPSFGLWTNYRIIWLNTYVYLIDNYVIVCTLCVYNMYERGMESCRTFFTFLSVPTSMCLHRQTNEQRYLNFDSIIN